MQEGPVQWAQRQLLTTAQKVFCPANTCQPAPTSHGPPWAQFMGCRVSLTPSTSIYLLLPTSVVSAVNDLTKRGLNGMTNKRYVTAHASAHSKMICNYLISVMQITPSSP